MKAKPRPFYSWIDDLKPTELREARTALALGIGPAGADRMRKELSGFVDPLRGDFTNKLNLPAWQSRFGDNCAEAVRRIDAKLAGRPVSAVATAPAKPAAAPLRGLARVAAAFASQTPKR